MGLNKSKGNMYDWITDTWNPLAGECPHKCSYCYVKSNYRPAVKKKYTGNPYLVEKELCKSLGSDKFIFVCSMIDLFAEEIPQAWIYDVIARCRRYNNKYLFQTKNPQRMIEYKGYFPENSILATTIESDTHRKEMGKTPSPWHRAYALHSLSSIFTTMVTIEPIFDFNVGILSKIVATCRPKWVNIGADSKGNKLPEPPADKVLKLITGLKKAKIEIKLKPNLKRIIGEFPKEATC